MVLTCNILSCKYLFLSIPFHCPFSSNISSFFLFFHSFLPPGSSFFLRFMHTFKSVTWSSSWKLLGMYVLNHVIRSILVFLIMLFLNLCYAIFAIFCSFPFIYLRKAFSRELTVETYLWNCCFTSFLWLLLNDIGEVKVK